MSPSRNLEILKRKARVAGLIAKETASVSHNCGVLAGTRFALEAVRGILLERLGPARPRKSNVLDKQYGTDTAENVKLHGLDITSPNYQYAIYYRPTDFAILAQILDHLSIRHEDYTFIDYGSGKGLVLLRAAAYPFKKVIGVEFARELHEIARRNLDCYPAHLRISEVELVNADALEFRPPTGNLVFYLYKPFEAPVTKKLIARIREFWRGRDVLVAYVWSKNSRVSCRPLWDAVDFLAKVDEGDSWTVYRAAD